MVKVEDLNRVKNNSKEIQRDNIPGMIQQIVDDIEKLESVAKKERIRNISLDKDEDYKWLLQEDPNFIYHVSIAVNIIDAKIKKQKEIRKDLIKVLELAEK